MRKILLFVFFLWPCVTFAQRTFYIDYVGGSNANSGTSQGAPWKSHPYMVHGGSCDSGAQTYTHQAGDQFIFKGGVVWPVQCFTLSIPLGGTPTSQDYYGACGGQSTALAACGGTTWPSSGWTKPKFDMQQQVPSGNNVITAGNFTGGADYITFDDIEVANQGVQLYTPNFEWGCGLIFTHFNQGVPATGPFHPAPGIIIENMFIHDWITNNSVTPATTGFSYCVGGIEGAQLVTNTEISDANGFAFINTTKTNGFFGGGVHWSGEVANSKIHDSWFGCVFQPLDSTQVVSCHDSEFYRIGFNSLSTSILCPNGSNCSIHDDTVYDNQTQSGYSGVYIYNNLFHDNNTGELLFVMYTAKVFNNVFYNNTNKGIVMTTPCGQNTPTCDNASFVGYAYNNTFDCSNGIVCFTTGTGGDNQGKPLLGKLFRENNIWITNGTSVQDQVTGVTDSNNHVMPTAEANSFGFTSATKYFPTSSDSAVKGVGINLNTSCSSVAGLSNLCKDAEGAPWFGGAYANRQINTGTGTCGGVSSPTPCWDLGGYVLSGSAPGPPTFVCSPTSINWPNQPLGVSFNPALTTTCSNTGGSSLTINSMVLSGSNASDFAFTTSPSGVNCNGNIAAGSSCTISFTFTPSALGSRAATFTVTDNAANSPQSIPISGTASYFVQGCTAGTPPTQSSTSCTFQSTQIGTSNYCTVYLFDISNTITSLTDTAGNVYVPVDVQAVQSSGGSGMIQRSFLASNIRNTSAPTLTANFGSSSSHFGGINCGEYVTVNNLDKTVTSIGNNASPTTSSLAITGTNELLITSVTPFNATASPSAGWTARPTSVNLYADQINSAGTYNATATLSATDIWIDQLSILAATSVTLSPANLSFSANVGTTSPPMTVTLTNNSASSLVVSSVTTSGTPTNAFTYANTGAPGQCTGGAFTLAAAASCTLNVTFSPTSGVSYSGSLSISDNAPGSPHIVSLTGQGTQATIAWTPTSYNFGNANVGTSLKSSNLHLSNTGAGSLNVSLTIGGANPAQFSIFTSTCSGSLAAGSGCDVVLQFSPVGAAAYSATLVETDSLASNSPQSIALSGTGISAPPMTSPSIPILLSSCVCSFPPTNSQTVFLNWSASPTQGVTGYNVYRFTGVCSPTAAFVKLTPTPITQLTYSDSNIIPGATYCYSETAVAPGAESAFNGQKQVTISSFTPPPNPAPTVNKK